eukprot:3925709-Pyramimonas_sp.AAC.1
MQMNHFHSEQLVCSCQQMSLLVTNVIIQEIVLLEWFTSLRGGLPGALTRLVAAIALTVWVGGWAHGKAAASAAAGSNGLPGTLAIGSHT